MLEEDAAELGDGDLAGIDPRREVPKLVVRLVHDGVMRLVLRRRRAEERRKETE
jgi:hypothetical protein